MNGDVEASWYFVRETRAVLSETRRMVEKTTGLMRAKLIAHNGKQRPS